jgi:hypothetical protein
MSTLGRTLTPLLVLAACLSWFVLPLLCWLTIGCLFAGFWEPARRIWTIWMLPSLVVVGVLLGSPFMGSHALGPPMHAALALLFMGITSPLLAIALILGPMRVDRSSDPGQVTSRAQPSQI